MRVYWVERIDFWAGLHLLACQLRYCAPAQLICYEPPTDSSLWRSLLRTAGIARIETMASALGDMTNERGINLYWHNDELMLTTTERSLAGLDIEHLARLTGGSPDILRVFLTRAALADLHQQTLRATALWGNSRGIASDDQYLLLPNSPFFNALADSYRRPGLSVAHYWRPFHWPRLIREYLAALKHLLRAGAARRQPTAPPTPVIAVQYVAGFDRGRVNDIPWFEASGLRPDQILIYAEGSRVTDAAAGARALSFRFSDLQRWQPTKERRRYISNVISSLATSPRLILRTPGLWSRRIWLGFWITRFLRSEARWRAFFAEHNVKVNIHVGDVDALSLASTAAMAKNGGLDFAFQLGSGVELDFEYRALTGRVLFTWGEFHREMTTKIGNKIFGKIPNRIITNGHAHDYLILRNAKTARNIREGLQSRGAKWIIAAFEAVARRDFIVSPSHMTEFYETLIEIASEDRTIAIVNKPRPGAEVRLSTPAADGMKALQSEGRWIQLPSESSTFEASLCADIAISLHIGTPAMEAAIAGVPHIYYDLTAWGQHPFYQFREQLIAINRAELKTLLETHRQNPAQYSTDPKLINYNRRLSNFNDGASCERIARSIKTAFSALNQGQTPAAATALLGTD